MVWNSNCDHFTYISFKKYLGSKDLKTSCILVHPNLHKSKNMFASHFGPLCSNKSCPSVLLEVHHTLWEPLLAFGRPWRPWRLQKRASKQGTRGDMYLANFKVKLIFGPSSQKNMSAGVIACCLHIVGAFISLWKALETLAASKKSWSFCFRLTVLLISN